jgi:hypothetical protein
MGKDVVESHKSNFSMLRDFLVYKYSIRKEEFKQEVADFVGMGTKTLERVLSDKRVVLQHECVKIADYLTKHIHGKKAEDSELCEHLKEMLEYYEYPHIDDLLTEKGFKPKVEPIIDKSTQYHREVFSNLPSKFEKVINRTGVNNLFEQGVKKSRFIFVDGFTGNGKSSSVYRFAKNQIKNKSDYKAIIWNQDDSGNLSITTIIDTILFTFKDYASNLGFMDKKNLAFRRLRDNKSILIIDNLETVNNEDVFSFLLNDVPLPTTIIMTSKHRINKYRELNPYSSEFFQLHVPGMTQEEWAALVKIRRANVPDIERAISIVNKELPEFIYKYCDGNPFGMLHVLGSISYRICNGENFQAIINDISKGKTHDGELYNPIKKSFDNILPDSNKRFLQALSLFPKYASLKALSYITPIKGVTESGDLEADSDLAECIDMCLLLNLLERDVISNKVYYFLSSMMKATLRSESYNKSGQSYDDIINRWVDYYRKFTNIGICYDDVKKMTPLDEGNEYLNVIAVLDYCYAHKRWEDYIIISRGSLYYFYTRGIFNLGKESIHLKRKTAAHEIGDYNMEYEALQNYINIASKTREIENITPYIQELNEIREKYTDSLSSGLKLKHIYIEGLCLLSSNDPENALKKFNLFLQAPKNNEHDYNAGIRWKAECLIQIGTSGSFKEAEELLEISEKHCLEINHERGIVHCGIMKANLFLKPENINKEMVERVIENVERFKNIIKDDKKYKADYYVIKAKISKLNGKNDTAVLFLEKAINEYYNIHGVNFVKELEGFFSDEIFRKVFANHSVFDL